MKENNPNPLFELDIYVENNNIMVFVSVLRFAKLWNTGIYKKMKK